MVNPLDGLHPTDNKMKDKLTIAYSTNRGNKMKDKLIIAYSTNRSENYQKEFNKHLYKSSGCKPKVISYQNNSGESLTSVYNAIWNSIPLKDQKESIFVLCHHDIKFKTNGWGKNLLNIFNTNKVDIIGLAGTEKLYQNSTWWLNKQGQFNTNDLWGKVWHTDGRKEWLSNFSSGKKCAKIQPVEVVDGLFLAFNPETCSQFDEDFKGFHFYDISFCYKNLKEGHKICVTETIPVVHESGGTLSPEWEQNRQLFIEKYQIN